MCCEWENFVLTPFGRCFSVGEWKGVRWMFSGLWVQQETQAVEQKWWSLFKIKSVCSACPPKGRGVCWWGCLETARDGQVSAVLEVLPWKGKRHAIPYPEWGCKFSFLRGTIRVGQAGFKSPPNVQKQLCCLRPTVRLQNLVIFARVAISGRWISS